MAPNKDLPFTSKERILELHQSGRKQMDIAQTVGCSQAAVSRIIKSGGVGKRRNCGRKKKTTKRDERKLTEIVKKNRFSSTTTLTSLWNNNLHKKQISSATTFRRLRKMGYTSRIPSVKPLLNAKQKAKRLRWAKAHADWTVEQWSKVIFSDESRFAMEFGDKGPRVWRRPHERYSPGCLRRSVKHPTSVLVWGCVSMEGTGNLCFINQMVNTEVYLETLEYHLLPSIETLFGDEECIFQQDLAPAHSSKATKKWLTDNNIQVLDWPANSPDLNVIEAIWDTMKRRMRNKKPTTSEQLKQVIMESWDSITALDIDKLVSSMPRRVAATIRAKGDVTKY